MIKIEETPSACLLPKFLQQVLWDQAKVSSPELHLGLPHRCRGPSTLLIFCCFARCIRRELECKWSGQSPTGMRVGVVIRGDSRMCCAIILTPVFLCLI